jgi:hypothetical protein
VNTTRRRIFPALAIALTAALSLAGISVPVNAATVAQSPEVVDLGNDEVVVPASSIPERVRKQATEDAKAASSIQVHSIWISVATISGATTQSTVTVPANETAARAFVTQLNTYWNRESGGKIALTFGGFETRALDSSCNLSSIYTASESAAFSGAFDTSAKWAGSFKHLVTLSTKECGTGLGSVGVDGGLVVSGLGSSASLGLPTALHEFGHNLGFSHGNASICATSSYDASAATFARSCATAEYYDFLDIMGYTVENSVPHLSSPQRIRTGYMTDYSELSSGTTTATIKPLGTDGTSGIRALAVSDPDGEIYYVEYRVSDDADANSAEFTGPTTCATYSSSYSRCYMDTEGSIGGVRILRAAASGASNSMETRVLAVGPLNSGGSATRRDTHLDAGESFRQLRECDDRGIRHRRLRPAPGHSRRRADSHAHSDPDTCHAGTDRHASRCHAPGNHADNNDDSDDSGPEDRDEVAHEGVPLPREEEDLEEGAREGEGTGDLRFRNGADRNARRLRQQEEARLVQAHREGERAGDDLDPEAPLQRHVLDQGRL